MESILVTIKHLEFYVMFGAVLAVAGGSMITMAYEFMRDKASKGLASTAESTQAPAGGSATINL